MHARRPVSINCLLVNIKKRVLLPTIFMGIRYMGPLFASLQMRQINMVEKVQIKIFTSIDLDTVDEEN